MNKYFQKKRKIATYFTRSIALVISALTFGVLFQSYHISSSLIAQEVERTATQTSNLQQRVFDFRLSLLKIHQDSSASNPELVKAVKQQSGYAIEKFFKSVDQQDPDNTPDFRFLTNLNAPVWDDGSAEFFGIDRQRLISIFNAVSLNNFWNIVKFRLNGENAYVLARRAPLVDPVSGEVIGYLVVAFLLNDNFHLIEDLRTRSHSQNLVLEIKNEVLSSTLTGKESYELNDILQDNITYNQDDQIFINKTHLSIDDIPTQLTLYSVQSNQNIHKLRFNFYLAVIFTLLATIVFSFILWRWLHKRIRAEIETLMHFTYTIAERGTEVKFDGSTIAEFDHFGRVLEHTFHRLSEQEKQFENLFNYSIVPTILWGTNSSLLRMNPAAVKHFSKDVDGNKPLYLELKQKLSKTISDVSHGKRSGEVITEINGRTLRWTVSPISSANGLESILTQGQDITSIADAEKQSRLAKIEAERTAGARADFLARMSHEVRTPLNGILGVAQLLKQSSTDEKHQEQVGVLCACSEHLLAVLNDILDFSKLEHGKFNITIAEFNLVDTVNAVEKIYRPLCEEKRVHFNLVHNLEQPTIVFSDQIRLNQIIFNLLNNAVKFTESGDITIKVQLTGQQTIEPQLIVEISDTGIGIDEKEQAIIFEPFIQSSSRVSKDHGGSGLGLSIVKNLVELFGGQISLSSEMNKGSTFSFSIPMQIKNQLPGTQPTSNDTLIHSNLYFTSEPRVLVVEDNKTNAFIARAFCEKFGLKVSWAKDGDEAIDMVGKSNFDLILMDNQLPRQDGIEITKIMRRELNVRAPIFACTADGSNETQEAFLNAGADFIIVKPIREEKVQQALMFFKSAFYRRN
ncbi:ATP-binding protein [Vibrio sp.]|nr:ATP-binding protein [Vibrio sp.]